jgi:hypothetical protein
LSTVPAAESAGQPANRVEAIHKGLHVSKNGCSDYFAA